MFKRLLASLALSVVLLACTPADATVLRPGNVAITVLTASTPDTLRVWAQWSASSVARPTGPITYQINWLQNGINRRAATITPLADTVKFGRAVFGTGVDTIDFNVRAVYQSRLSAQTAISRVYPNGDNQIPSMPVITSVDTL